MKKERKKKRKDEKRKKHRKKKTKKKKTEEKRQRSWSGPTGALRDAGEVAPKKQLPLGQPWPFTGPQERV